MSYGYLCPVCELPTDTLEPCPDCVDISAEKLSKKEKLLCSGCGCKFEVSADIAKLMLAWERSQSNPIVCALCVALQVGEDFEESFVDA